MRLTVVVADAFAREELEEVEVEKRSQLILPVLQLR
jgi:hypothetical protein